MSDSAKPLAWVTGASGLIGQEIVNTTRLYNLPWNVRPLSRNDLDLLDRKAVEKLFKAERPQLIIHCAALSRSPACEGNPTLAHQVNVELTRHLLELARDARFLFFSTDLVFDGQKGNYTENDSPNPLMVYGSTKLLAEKFVQQHPSHIIIRISLTGGNSRTKDRGFNEEMENAWRAGKVLNLFTDEFRCPMHAATPAKAVWELALQNARGLFHLNGAEKLSRYDLGMLVASKHPELNPQIVATSRRDYKGAPRPADTTLNCSKIAPLLSFKIPALSECLRDHPQMKF